MSHPKLESRVENQSPPKVSARASPFSAERRAPISGGATAAAFRSAGTSQNGGLGRQLWPMMQEARSLLMLSPGYLQCPRESAAPAEFKFAGAEQFFEQSNLRDMCSAWMRSVYLTSSISLVVDLICEIASNPIESNVLAREEEIID